MVGAARPRSPTTPGSGPAGSGPSSASSTPPCGSSARRATTGAASPGSPSSPGCSRASFYQYFSGKEDVFRHLAGQVARQLSASTEALGLVTPDADGWRSIRAWVARYAEIYERYEPVFVVFQTAAESDAAVAGGSRPHGRAARGRLRSRLTATTLPPRQLDPVVRLLLECLPRAFDTARILRAAAPGAYPEERVGGRDGRRRAPHPVRPPGRQRARARRPPAAGARVQPGDAGGAGRRRRGARADPGRPAHARGPDGRGARAVRGPRLPRHPRRRRRGGRRAVARGVLPLLREQGPSRPRARRAGDPHRVRGPGRHPRGGARRGGPHRRRCGAGCGATTPPRPARRR